MNTTAMTDKEFSTLQAEYAIKGQTLYLHTAHDARRFLAQIGGVHE